jgi:RNA polymerase sigma-70 factor (ECF subfamily)
VSARCPERAADGPLPWLFGVARKVLANHRRAAARRGRLEQRIADQPHAGQHLILGTGGSPALTALERLGPEDQELLKLVAWEGLSHAEIASVLGITVNAVAIRVHRARRRYREAQDGPSMKGSRVSRTVTAVRGRMFGSAGRNEAR